MHTDGYDRELMLHRQRMRSLISHAVSIFNDEELVRAWAAIKTIDDERSEQDRLTEAGILSPTGR